MSVNYNGKVQNVTSYIKTYTPNINASAGLSNLWSTSKIADDDNANANVIIPASPYYSNLYIPGNLYLDGNFINASDMNLKQNIMPLKKEQTNKLLNLNTYSYTYKSDETNKLHFGLIAQEVEEELPELVIEKPHTDANVDTNTNNYKGVNYLELVPLLVSVVQTQQKQINELQNKLNTFIKKF
uniref:Peptidase S74 domain-containing protein n=1 Tax=viral metagenome TaxID=1070528 RepID=A0A6C0IUC6_9ZZZZ